MAYSELIKSFERIRTYMREFFVYGFKSRAEFNLRSARSYDNERRRIESWLGDYMGFRQDERGKNVFLSVDSRAIAENPLYNAFKAKSFTSGDITFHFYILDILADGGKKGLREITEAIADEYASHFDGFDGLDDSTVRKKLREYTELGILKTEKRGRELAYSISPDGTDLKIWREAVLFFSEVDPVGAVGSFILDKYDAKPGFFRFKHHYLLHAMDSEVLCTILEAMAENRAAELTVKRRRGSDERVQTVFPVKIYISTQTGRQYLLCYHYRFGRPTFFRLDTIHRVTMGSVEHNPERYSGWYENYAKHLWGVSSGEAPDLDHIEMTVRFGSNEGFILDRLNREKRGGKVEIIGEGIARFSANIYDATEILPWLRTFIGRIESLECTNRHVTDTFYADLDRMASMYGDDCNAV